MRHAGRYAASRGDASPHTVHYGAASGACRRMVLPEAIVNQISTVRFSRAASWLAGAAALASFAGQSGARQAPIESIAKLAFTASAPAPEMPDNDYFSEEELDDLFGPIALYPDVLLSAVLGASVFPDQVFAAATLVAGGATREQIEAQDWEDPVKAVAQVPEVVAMLAAYPDWTKAMGSAFLTQARDVMDSIQRLRAIAFDNGVLETSPQQVVTVQQETQKIVIMPANPTVIYVPQYNPSVVFVRDNRAVARAGWIGFGTGIAVGAIIWGGSCNWNGGFIGWGRGWGWGGWGNTRINNNVNINVNNNVNINRPGGRPDRPAFDRPGGRPPAGSGNAGGRPDAGRPGIDRPGRPDINRPGGDRPGINRPGGDRPSIDRPGTGRPGNPSGINRPGSGNAGGVNRPGNRDRIGQEGSRWQPNTGNRPGGGQPGGIGGAGGSRPSDWRNNAARPDARPPSSIGSGANRPGGINRPSAPSNPGVNRPTTLPANRAPNTPTTRPGNTPVTRAPNVQPNRGGNAGGNRANSPARPSNPTTMPSAGAGTGNRPSGFSGGPSNAAAARGAASRNAGGGGAGAGGGGGRGGRGG